MTWLQNYDPIGSPWLSTLVAAFPVIVLLGAIASGRVRIHHAALIGLAAASVVALFVYKMPVAAWAGAGVYGALFGLFPIGWIILNVLFLYQLTVKAGLFAVLRDSLARVAPDPRVQLILIAFCFGAFIEGVAGFGAPVAITGAILIQLGFNPVTASCLALIANTAPVAFGSLGIPITTLEQVTGLDALKVSKMVGRQLPIFSAIIPFWVVGALAGWRGMIAVWPSPCRSSSSPTSTAHGSSTPLPGPAPSAPWCCCAGSGNPPMAGSSRPIHLHLRPSPAALPPSFRPAPSSRPGCLG